MNNNLDSWVAAFTQIMAIDMGALQQPTQNAEQVEALNKEKGWKLKGLVSGTLLTLLQKYE